MLNVTLNKAPDPIETAKNIRTLLNTLPDYLKSGQPRTVCSFRMPMPQCEAFIGEVETLVGIQPGWTLRRVVKDNYVHLEWTQPGKPNAEENAEV